MRRRILVVPEWYPFPDEPRLGTWAREHARAIAADHDVAVLASWFDPAPGLAPFGIEETLDEGIRTIRVRYRELPRWALSFPLRVAGLAVAMRRLRRSGFDPELIHAHVFYSGLAALLIRPRGTPLVVSEHFTGFALGHVSGLTARIARGVFERADLVCPVSDELDRRIGTLGVGPGHRRVIGNLSDENVFHPPPDGTEPGGEARMVTVVSLEHKKGVDVLIDALAGVARRRTDWRLDIVGAGPDRADLEGRARAAGLDGRVSFVGPLSRDQVAERLRSSSFFVLPSRQENAPVALSEALLTGLPAIGTRVGGVPDMIAAEDGLVVESRDAEALGTAIVEMLDGHAGYDRAAIAARARRRYGRVAMAATWSEVYDALLAGRPVPSRAAGP